METYRNCKGKVQNVVEHRGWENMLICIWWLSEKHLLSTLQSVIEGEIGTFKKSSKFQAEGKAGSAKRYCMNFEEENNQCEGCVELGLLRV